MARASIVWGAGLMAAAATVSLSASCGGLVASAADDAKRDRGASPEDDASNVPPRARPKDPGNDPVSPPKPGPKLPSVVQRCSFSDGAFYVALEEKIDLAVRRDGATLRFYVSNGQALRRYDLVSDSPCLLQRDSTFGTNGEITFSQGAYTLDEQGTVWLSRDHHLRRAAPQLPNLSCAVDPRYVPDEDGDNGYVIGALFLDEGGKAGWAMGGPPGKLGRLTLGGDACSVTLVDAPFTMALRANTPRDAQKRLHVIDAPIVGAVGIHTPEGALVSIYFGKTGPTSPVATDVTSCAGGACVLGATSAGQSITYVTDDGAPRAVVSVIAGLRAVRIAADRVGPVFLAGPTDTTLEAEHQVVIQLAPPPPP